MRIIELAACDATLHIAPELGGAITSFAVGGTPMLRPTPDAALDERDVGRTACYPLVPYSNRIRNAKLRFAGRDFVLARNFGTHPHAIHGVGWQRAWSVADASREHARLVLRHEPHGDDAAAWPWPFHATQTFHLADVATANGRVLTALTVTLTLCNPGAAAFPFGLGWHPYFRRHATTKLGFHADRVWQNDPTHLPVSRVDIPPGWRFAPPRTLDVVALDNVFTGWEGAATIGDPAYGTSIAIEADRACAFIVVYAPPDDNFVAVEPVTHETDAFNRAARGVSGTGMRILPPGAAFSCTMRIAAAAAG